MVFVVVQIWILLFWVMTLIVVIAYQYFGGTYHVHIQGRLKICKNKVLRIGEPRREGYKMRNFIKDIHPSLLLGQ